MGFGPSRERLGKGNLYYSVSDGKVASCLDEPRTPVALALILTHIFFGSLVERNEMVEVVIHLRYDLAS